MIEIQRQKRVLSMMITAHSVLRDRYLRLSSTFEISLLAASVILNAFVFIDDVYISRMTNISSDDQKMVIGIFSIIVFAISIVLLQVQWKEKAESHGKSLDPLFRLLQESRLINNLADGPDKDLALTKFNERYVEVFNSIVPIPDKKFNSLKLIHCRKIELSKLIDKYPKSRLFILKIRLFLSSFK
jgi:hypothetical protein